MKKGIPTILDWLNTVRGLAAILVLLEHILLYVNLNLENPIKWIDYITFEYLNIGKIGVAIFFLISGYLVPLSLKKRGVKPFIINRIGRLYPMYWLSIIACGIVLGYQGMSYVDVAVNFSMLQTFFKVPDILGVYWTLPIEILLYVVIVILGPYLWELTSLCGIITISFAGTIGLAIVRNILWHSCPLAVGLLISIALIGHIIRLYKEKIIKVNKLVIGVIAFEVTVIICSLLGYSRNMGHSENWLCYTLTYTVALMLFLVFSLSQKNIVAFSLISGISYELYLFQEIVYTYMFERFYPYHSISVFTVAILAFAGSISVALILNKIYGYFRDIWTKYVDK